MSLARNHYVGPPGTPSAADDDSATVGMECTVRQDAFARVWAETGNQAAAYRTAYTVGEKTLPNTIWANASRIAAIPCVRKKADEYRQQATLEMIMSVREAFAWQIDIATADPNEIAYVAKRACRNCHGVGHRYQWTDDEEYVEACCKALDLGQNPPTDEGGYGYTRGVDPALDCPHCLGLGTPENVINDTRNLTGKARKLFKGFDIKNGELVIVMHDQAKAWEMACRMLGAFNDKLDLRTPTERQGATKLPDGVTEQDTARAYLAMIG